MSTWASVRLEFLRGMMSRADIFNETGLNATMQSEILEGVYSPGGYTRDLLRNLYQRTTYGLMRDIGFSPSQASRFRGYIPDSVSDRITTVQNLISDLAKGALDLKLEKTGLSLSGAAYDDALDDYMDTVKEGFSHSTKTYEEWADYGRH